MGKYDGLLTRVARIDMNKVIKFEGGYFSFAFGDEIALVLKGKFYILNCQGDLLWNAVANFIKMNPTIDMIKEYWYNKYKLKQFDISYWSNNFEDLK